MKNKKGVALLLVLVAGIWGTITFKIVKQLYFPDGAELSTNGVVAKEAKKSASTLSYSLTYPDPFLKFRNSSAASEEREPSTFASFAVEEVVAPVAKPAVIQPVGLKFIGWVANSHHALKEAMVEQNGRTQILEVGEELDGFKVVQVFADSLIVSREGNRFCLKRHS